MPPKKSTTSAHGRAKSEEGIFQNEKGSDFLGETHKETKKTVARKPRLKAKKRNSPPREVIKVKIFSPSLAGKLKATNKAQVQVQKNGIARRKTVAPKGPKTKPAKIKRILSKQEKIAFANQVAQAQLVQGTPIMAEPVYVPMEPPPPTQPVAPPQRVNQPTVKTVTNGRRHRKTTAEKSEEAQGQLFQTSVEPSCTNPHSFEEESKVRKKFIKKPKQCKKKASKNTEVAATATPQPPQQSHPQENDIKPPQAKRARGRPRKIIIDSDSVATTPPRPLRVNRQDSTRSTDESIDTIRENARKLEENLVRPESKASDTFSWVADISTSSRSTPSKTKSVVIDGKLASVKLIDFRKHSPATSTQASSLSDNMSSPRKSARSPTKQLAENNRPTKKADKRHLDNDGSREGENKRPRKKRDEVPREKSKKKQNKEKRSRSSRRKNREEQQSEISRLEEEKRRIEELLKFTEATISNLPKKHRSHSKDSAKPSSSGASVASTSSERRPSSRDSASKKRQNRGTDKPKDGLVSTTVGPQNSVTMAPNVESVPSSVTGSSSTSISMWDTRTSVSTESAETDKMKSVLKSLSRVLNNFDIEFIQWLAKEDENSNGKPATEITSKVLKHEDEAIRVCQDFKRNMSELSSSEKSVEYRSEGSDEVPNPEVEVNRETDQVSYGSEIRVESASLMPMDIPDAPTKDNYNDYDVYKSRNKDYADDGDDVISLFAESLSGFDSVRNSVRSARDSPIEEFREPMAPFNPIAAHIEETPVVKTKTADVQKQNADSSTYLYASTSDLNSTKRTPTHTVTDMPKTNEDRPLLMADIFKSTTNHLGSTVFKGVCFYNLISQCKKAQCVFPHVIPDHIQIKNKLNSLPEPKFVHEYLLMRKYPALRKRFMVLYVDECLKRDLTRFLVEMALDATREEPAIKTYIMETTLLHLNDKDLETCKDLLLDPSLTYCKPLSDIFMLTIADTQNFSRFKPVFVKLTKFVVQREHRFDLIVATHILERICILQYEVSIAEAAVSLIKNTSAAIFESSLVDKFLAQLAVKNLVAYDDLVNYREQVYKRSLDAQSVLTQPSVENVRYTSPDTTHLDALQNKPPEEAPPITITRTVNFDHSRANRTAPLTPPMDVFAKPPMVAPSSDNFVKPVFSGPPFGAWKRERATFRSPEGWSPRMMGTMGRGRFINHRAFGRGRPNGHRWPRQ